MPDQSQSNADQPVSGKTDQQTGNPADTSANTQDAATAESQASNVSRASEGQQTQVAANTTDAPVVTSGDAQAAGDSGDDYDDEEKWSYRDLQQEAKNRDLDAGGKRPELVARLREASSGAEGVSASGPQVDGGDSSQNLGAPTTDADTSGQPPTPRGEVDPSQSPVGGSIGFGQSGRGQDHAEILQGLSNDRRAQQLAAVQERSGQSEG